MNKPTNKQTLDYLTYNQRYLVSRKLDKWKKDNDFKSLFKQCVEQEKAIEKRIQEDYKNMTYPVQSSQQTIVVSNITVNVTFCDADGNFITSYMDDPVVTPLRERLEKRIADLIHTVGLNGRTPEVETELLWWEDDSLID